MKYYMIAGEASGDLHGSNLIKGLKAKDPNCQIRCWGGDLMKEAGGELYHHYKDTAVNGFVEVVTKLGKIFSNLKDCKRDILEYNPDVVVLIDYPGFNFRIAEFAHNKGFKVFYYIAPKIWAWKENRGKRLKKYVDKLFIIFPFEIDYFKNRWQIDAIYKGNPLLDSIDQYPYINEDKESFCNRMNSKYGTSLNPNDKYLALLAGSRRSEISYLLPVLLKTMKYFPGYKFFFAAAPSTPLSFYQEIIKKNGFSEDCMSIIYGETYSIMKHSDAAMISSGTASLEAALVGVPQVVCYNASELSYIIAKALVKLKYISLANLIADKLIFKELLQHECNPEMISDEVKRLLNDAPYREKMLKEYAEVRSLLGGGGASEAVAQAMIDELSK
ncbi:MAG: lipid-A-disaccharide synthase [Bacteroidales bacterium]|nr:lipid-A-disaccharide synthase [Bacteroidales bacterium]